MNFISLQKFYDDLTIRRGFFALIIVHTSLLGWSAAIHSPTQDEVAHLPAGLCIWKFGDFSVYRVNPPLVRIVAALPVLAADHEQDWRGYSQTTSHRQEWALGRNFIRANQERSVRLFTLARWVCIPFSLLGMWVCYRWASDSFSDQSGLVAATLWCFSPNIIGHGSLITPDVAAVSMGVFAAWRFSIWLKESSVPNTFLSGLTLGLALLTKSYWVTLIGLWVMIACTNIARSNAKGSRKRKSIQLLLILLLGLNVLNLGYGFQGTGTRLGDFKFYSTSLSGELRNPGESLPGNRFAESWLRIIPIPLPRDYVTGIDIQKVDFEKGKWSYFCGEVKEPGGWWQYYLVGLFLKIPLGTILLLLAGLYLLRDHQMRSKVIELCPLVLPAMLLLIIASLETGMNRHVRYVFPVLPVIYIIGSTVIIRWKKLALMLLLSSILSSLSVYPQSLSYFSYLTGGPDRGHQYLIDSNLDWGQDLLAVRDWLEKNPEKRPAFIGWAGDYPPKSLGVNVELVSMRQIKPGWYFISRSERYHPKGHLKIFQNMKPIGQIHYTFDIYRVDQTLSNLKNDNENQ